MLVVNNRDLFNLMLTDLEYSNVIAVDTETTGLDPHSDRLLILSFATARQSYALALHWFSEEDLQRLVPIFLDDTKVKVAHNAVFDLKFILSKFDLIVRNVHCTYITEQVLKAGLRVQGFSLADVAARRLGVKLDKAVRSGFLDREDLNFSPEEMSYAAQDAAVLLPLYEQQMLELKAENQQRVYDLECSLIPITTLMEYHGVLMDRDRLIEARPVVQQVIDQADRSLQNAIIGGGGGQTILFAKGGYRVVNTASPKQMLEVFHRMGIGVASLNKKDVSDWDSRWQDQQSERVDPTDDFHVGFAHPVLRMHAVRTAAAKLQGTYIEGLLEKINPHTQRIHPGFKQCGAVSTGRYSSVGPKLCWAFSR
jgi:DNA polymerase-1